jgi:hypothetical protein
LSFPLISLHTSYLNSRVLQSNISETDISSFDAIAQDNDFLLKGEDKSPSYNKNSRKLVNAIEHNTIDVYPREYYNTFWTNISLSVLITILSLSIVYILWTKYHQYYKNQAGSLSPSYSEDSINTQIEEENDNITNKYVKLQMDKCIKLQTTTTF